MKNILKYLFIISITLSSYVQANEKIVNIDNIIKTLQKDNKHTMLFFHMTYCPYCKKMKKKTFQDTFIKNTIKKDFHFVDINTNSEELVYFQKEEFNTHELAHSLDINFYPTILFINKNGNIIYTVKGYRNIEKFQTILKYIKSNSYNEMDLSDFTAELELEEE